LSQAKLDDITKQLQVGRKSTKDPLSKVRSNARCLTAPHMRELFNQEKFAQNEKIRQEEEKRKLKAAKEDEFKRRMAEASTVHLTRRFSTFTTREDLLFLGRVLNIPDSVFESLKSKDIRNVIARYIDEHSEEIALDPRISILVNPNKKARPNPSSSAGEQLSNAFVLNITPPLTNSDSHIDPHLLALSK
jgi:hypothetical protein